MKTLFANRLFLWLFVGLLFFAAITRFYRLSQPQAYVFDEVYHALTAKLIARNDVRAYEWWNPPVEPNTAVDWLHPPFAKYTQALGIKIFGENTFGWRVSSAVFGVMVIGLIVLLTWELFHDRGIALLAGSFAALDGLLLVQSRIAMNDIHVTFFILLTCLFYVRYRKDSTPLKLLLTGIAAGFALASKWSGVFVIAILGVSEFLLMAETFFAHRKYSAEPFKLTTLVRKAFFLLIIPFTIYVLGYTHMFLQGKTLICEGNQIEQGKCYCSQESSWWVNILKKVSPPNTKYFESLEARGGCKRLISHFSELHHQIWWYQTNLKATHPYQSRPIEWFLNLRPVWMYVEYQPGMLTNIYAQGNTTLFWLGDIAVFMTAFQLFAQMIDGLVAKPEKKKVVQHKHALPQLHPLLFTLIAYLFVWTPWEASPRIMFFYHYTPAVPFLCILLAFWLKEMWGDEEEIKDLTELNLRRGAVALVCFFILINFIVFYPNWTALPVADTFKQWYFLLPSWK